MQRTRTRVLIVDDEPSICKALSIALVRAGFSIKTSLTGDGGLRLLKKEPFDLLVLDLRMPDMRGDVFYELASANHPELANRTLFITGDISERAEKIIGGCKCPLLCKPFEVMDLIHSMNSMVPRSQGASA